VVVVHQAYYSLAILSLSFYFVVLALQFAQKLGAAYFQGLVATYLLSLALGIYWAPRSLPRSRHDEAIAETRERNWLPWVIAGQTIAVSIGVVLGVWYSRGGGSWMRPAAFGVGALASMLLVTLGVSILYRLLLFMRNPIPPEALGETGVKP
jgi:hypothetical protein